MSRTVPVWCALLAAAAVLAGCSDDKPSYKEVTCGEYVKLASADDAVTNGALSIASDYLNATPINPVNGAADVARFGDAIVSACRGHSASTKIIDLESEVAADYGG